MASDATFRGKSEAKPEQPGKGPEGKTEQAISSSTEVTPPFTSYHQQMGKPYIVEHFDIGDYWDDPSGGFETEVQMINDYLSHRIEQGDIADTVEAVRNELKAMEKINNLKKEERTVVKIGKLAAYAEFLNKADGIEKTYRKYRH
jgi:hypothetical protein